MRPGEVVEAAIWLDGTESPKTRAWFERMVKDHLDELCDLAHVVRGPVRWSELKPGDNYVPSVPDHIRGPKVRLLVAAADIVAGKPYSPARSFIARLDPADLNRLRVLTRRAHARHFPGQRLTDRECDMIIDSFGPEAAAAAVRRAVDGGTIH